MRGLILEGGAMRAGFVAGAVMALMDKRLTNFDAAMAVSASVPTLAYFAAGQREEIECVWRHELDTPNLVCYRNIPATSFSLSTERPIIDIDYLVYKVFKNKYPLDIQSLVRSQIDCFFALTKVPDGSLAFLRPSDDDIYETFKAALAVPCCYPGTVCLGNYEYIDGGTVNPLPVRSLYHKKTDRILAILSKPLDRESDPPGLFERILFWRYFRSYDWVLDRLWASGRVYNEEASTLGHLAADTPPKALIICPDKIPPAKFITRDSKKINKTIDLGYRKVEEYEDEIEQFLKEEFL
jgi:predicted patatin/cPLA2 family phospholipase